MCVSIVYLQYMRTILCVCLWEICDHMVVTYAMKDYIFDISQHPPSMNSVFYMEMIVNLNMLNMIDIM
jgi:hypothetical protein